MTFLRAFFLLSQIIILTESLRDSSFKYWTFKHLWEHTKHENTLELEQQVPMWSQEIHFGFSSLCHGQTAYLWMISLCEMYSNVMCVPHLLSDHKRPITNMTNKFSWMQLQQPLWRLCSRGKSRFEGKRIKLAIGFMDDELPQSNGKKVRSSNPAWFLQRLFAKDGDWKRKPELLLNCLNIEPTFHYNIRGNATLTQFGSSLGKSVNSRPLGFTGRNQNPSFSDLALAATHSNWNEKFNCLGTNCK